MSSFRGSLTAAEHAATYPAPGMRRCTRCRQVKPFAEFTASKVSPTGTASFCKKCKVLHNRASAARVASRGEDLTASDRFWAKVQKTDTCWLWTGGKGYMGYGRFVYRGRLEQAHRVSLMLAGMDLPDKRETGLVIDHICKVAACVRPEHLRIVTQADNCGPLADPTPHELNRQKTECSKGHPLSGSNLAIIGAGRRQRATRQCITCYPLSWWRCVVPRACPPGIKPTRHTAWIGPFRAEDE